MWAEANNYWYRGSKIAKNQGGSLNCKPELIILEEPMNNNKLQFVDIPAMINKNYDVLESLAQETIKNIQYI